MSDASGGPALYCCLTRRAEGVADVLPRPATAAEFTDRDRGRPVYFRSEPHQLGEGLDVRRSNTWPSCSDHPPAHRKVGRGIYRAFHGKVSLPRP
jgi:hypothetical protein